MFSVVAVNSKAINIKNIKHMVTKKIMWRIY